mmetsp:Transcript_4926/g.11962  ORF Transcript_4926/g.11962 Transcript_4926/m.11962 type:complete len:655 (-) Transcript_4926:1802-3766(-)
MQKASEFGVFEVLLESECSLDPFLDWALSEKPSCGELPDHVREYCNTEPPKKARKAILATVKDEFSLEDTQVCGQSLLRDTSRDGAAKSLDAGFSNAKDDFPDLATSLKAVSMKKEPARRRLVPTPVAGNAQCASAGNATSRMPGEVQQPVVGKGTSNHSLQAPQPQEAQKKGAWGRPHRLPWATCAVSAPPPRPPPLPPPRAEAEHRAEPKRQPPDTEGSGRAVLVAVEEDREPPRSEALPRRLRRLSLLHGALLRCGAVPDLAAELCQLLRLLNPDDPQACRGRRHGPEAVSSYAVSALSAAGNALLASPPELLKLLTDGGSAVSEKLRAEAPSLFTAASRAVAERHGRRRYHQKNFISAAGSTPERASTVSRWMAAHHHRSRSLVQTHEEDQLINNLERSRDEFIRIMQDAARSPFSMNKPTAGELGATTEEAELLPAVRSMRARASEFMGRLHTNNFAVFAELFLAGFMQAARTGEVFMDEKLASLEQKDPTRFHRLNQRFQNQSQSQWKQQGHSRGDYRQQGRGRTAGKSHYGGSNTDSDAFAIATASLVLEFPEPLRLFVIFLEVSDSARLNCCLRRAACQILLNMSHISHSGTAPNQSSDHLQAVGGSLAQFGITVGERAAQAVALGQLLSYLSFACGQQAGCVATT